MSSLIIHFEPDVAEYDVRLSQVVAGTLER